MEIGVDGLPKVTLSFDDRERLVRRKSGLFSLDYALAAGGVLGVPLPSVIEVYGQPHVGKSSLCYYLAGALGQSGQIEVCDLEGLDTNYVLQTVERTGFSGNINVVPIFDHKDNFKTHTDMLNESVARLRSDPEVNAMIFDSVGAFMSDAEEHGDVGEAFMGRRAKIVAQFARKAVTYIRAKENKPVVLVVNHVHSMLVGHGSQTAGGRTMKHMAATRLSLWQKEVVQKKIDGEPTPIAYRVAGSVEKIRYGNRGKKFGFVVIPEYGVSRELSALYDASDVGIVNRGTVVKYQGESLGYISTLVEDARKGNHKKFEPIIQELEDYYDKKFLGTSSESDPESEA